MPSSIIGIDDNVRLRDSPLFDVQLLAGTDAVAAFPYSMSQVNELSKKVVDIQCGGQKNTAAFVLMFLPNSRPFVTQIFSNRLEIGFLGRAGKGLFDFRVPYCVGAFPAHVTFRFGDEANVVRLRR